MAYPAFSRPCQASGPKEVKRIAHFIETGIPGGAEQVMLDLCMSIKHDMPGHEPVVLTFGHEWTIEQCRQKQIEHLTMPYLPLFKRTLLLPLFGLMLAIWLRRQRIHLVHSHLFGPITGAAFATFLSRLPHVGTLHDIYMIKEKPARIRLLQLASMLGTKLVTVSEQMRSFYARGIDPARLQTIYNGIDTSLFSPAVHRSATQAPTEQAELPAVRIVCVGRLIELKQVDKVITACVELLGNNDLSLTVVGDGPEKEALMALSKDHSDRIQFTGQQDGSERFLQAADIFVQFSNTEGLSRSIIEASACGLPCVVSDVGGNREIVIDRQSGYVIAHDDEHALTRALGKLVGDAGLRARFGEAARAHAVDLFDAAACNHRYQTLYKSLFD